ncbi:MAG: PadR family transcriptional regulator [Clostridiaceae bacterium]|jgi:DNA-binding PadR family transcriptional regulator|nr:PadR family transcriptional regulator [Clostridiaceae bacterium]
MINLLILYVLQSRELTMYAIQKHILMYFAPYTNPSFGALKPALRKLEEQGYIKSRQTMTDGGKLSGYYLRTKEGEDFLKKTILEQLSENPLQFLSNARIKLSCADILEEKERKSLFFELKTLAMKFKLDAENILNNEYIDLTFYQKIVLDNSICEYKNFITIIEGLEKDNARTH